MRAKRWWYEHPKRNWDLRDWLVPYFKFFKCGDQFCNDTLFIRIPLLGDITIRTGKRPFRINNKCEQCIAEYGPWCQGCEGCHHGPRCHPWLECEHEAKLLRCPACGGDYCPECEPTPKQTCPYRGARL